MSGENLNPNKWADVIENIVNKNLVEVPIKKTRKAKAPTENIKEVKVEVPIKKTRKRKPKIEDKNND